jgi:hypothetical protein
MKQSDLGKKITGPHCTVSRSFVQSTVYNDIRMATSTEKNWIARRRDLLLGDKPHGPNLSDLAECVILCTSWLQSPGKVYCRAVNI